MIKNTALYVSLATAALAREHTSDVQSEAQISAMLSGMHKYQRYQKTYKPQRHNTIWTNGNIALKTLQNHDYDAGRADVLLIPSMVNKYYIFDLSDNSSFMKFLAARGLNPYVLDWGKADDKMSETTIEKALDGIFDFLKNDKPLHALGYCMGGTLLLNAYNQFNTKPDTLVLLATPWDFHAGSGMLRKATEFWLPSANGHLNTEENVSKNLLHRLFTMIDPHAPLRKFAKFDDMGEGSTAFENFIATEHWVQDGRDLSPEIARLCIQDWFMRNSLINKQDKISCPVLISAARHDRLVEPPMSLAIKEKIVPDADIIQPDCGHIGIMTGKNAQKELWKPVADWILSIAA